MAKKNKKTNSTGLALACWVLGILILLIAFLVKQDDIKTNLKTTRFFERVFGSTPEFIEKHEVKEKPVEEEKETVITLKTEEPVKQEVPVKVEEKKEEVKTEPVVEKPKTTEVKKVQEPVVEKKPEVKTITTVSQKLYLVYIGEDGSLSRKQVVRSVEKNDSPLMTNLNLLLRGPDRSESSKGYISLIPEGTKLLSASVRSGIAYLNFSEDFEFNQYGPDGYKGQLMQIVYTATEFSTVTGVQFLIEGQKKEYLGSEGVWIGSPLSRNSF